MDFYDFGKISMPLAWLLCLVHGRHAFDMASLTLVWPVCLYASGVAPMPLAWRSCLHFGLYAFGMARNFAMAKSLTQYYPGLS